uniref:BTB domain-containing protein n=1 Tax=Panagrolaimus superbus TaxID=310955 RepID=A0A914ZE75_9BILA
MSSKNADPASIISSLFRTDFDDSSSLSTSNLNFLGQPRKRRRSIHEEYRCLLEQGKLYLQPMDNTESFIHWVMDGDKKIAIYCKVCEKFLGPNKGGSFFTHVRTCKNQIFPGTLPAAFISEQQKEEFSFTVVDAIGKDLNLFTQLNTEAFKQCIQKALIIGFESKQPGYGPPDVAELFKNSGMEAFVNEEGEESSNESFKDDILNVVIKDEEATATTIRPSFEMKNLNFEKRASTIGEEIFNANEYTDVILHTSDGKEITAHRCFLSNASPVFKSLFEKDTINLSKIDIEFDENITLKAVQFCYGNYFIVDGFENQLLEFAKIYQIQELKERCLSHLNDTVTSFNVCQIIEIAYQHNYECLKQKCIQTILENKGAVGKDQINNLPPPILCDILFAQ